MHSPRLFSQNYSFPAKTWIKILGHLKHKKGISYLELGVYEGRSFLWVGENLISANSRMDAVDEFHYDETFRRFNENVETLRKNNVIRIFSGRTEKILPGLKYQDYDLIYVDAGHDYLHVWNDLVQAWPLLKTGGFMVMDDYLWMKFLMPRAERPEKAIDDFLRAAKGSFRLRCKFSQVFVQKTRELPGSVKVIEMSSPQIPKGGLILPRKIGDFLLNVFYFFYELKQSVLLNFYRQI